jgi:acyl-CoA thioesterase YciA
MELISTHICKGSEIGVHNNMFGGTLMTYLDESAGAFTSQLCDTPRMVTKKVEEIVFLEPVKVGNILKIYGEPVRIGNSSITVALEVRKHNVCTGVQKVVCSTKMVFVKIDEEGNAVPISDKAKIRIQLKLDNSGINMN